MAQSTIKTTAAQRKLEAKALAEKSKSEGMRVLYGAGYSVSRVAEIFGVGYPFAYGVAKRAGFALTAATRRPVKAVKAAAAKVTKVATAAKANRSAKATAAKKPGRPTAARRAANRKVTA